MKRVLLFALSALLIISLLSCCTKIPKPLSSDELLQLGEKYLCELDYEQAIIQFQKLIEIEPKNSRAYTGLAEAYIGLGNTDKAADILRLGLEELPDNTELVAMLEVLKKTAASPETSAELSPQPESTPASEITTEPFSGIEADQIFSVDGIILGKSDISDAKSKYGGHSDYKSNLMNNDSVDTVYSMPYLGDDNPDNDMQFGYLFSQTIGTNYIDAIYVSSPGILCMGSYYIGDDATEIPYELLNYTDGKRTVVVTIQDGMIESFTFNMQ